MSCSLVAPHCGDFPPLCAASVRSAPDQESVVLCRGRFFPLSDPRSRGASTVRAPEQRAERPCSGQVALCRAAGSVNWAAGQALRQKLAAPAFIIVRQTVALEALWLHARAVRSVLWRYLHSPGKACSSSVGEGVVKEAGFHSSTTRWIFICPSFSY